jgi:phosphate-selective porin OprO/OprP
MNIRTVIGRPATRAALLALLMSGAATSAMAADDADLAALRAQIQALNERLNTLQAAADADRATVAAVKTDAETTTATVTKLAAAPTVAVSNGRPTFATADGRFTASIRGVAMIDGALFDQDAPGPLATDLRRGAGSGDTARARDFNAGTNIRRARLGVEGKVFGDFTYNLLYETGGSGTEDAGHIQEAWVQYNGIKPLTIRIGAFEPQVGLSANSSTSAMPFLERPAAAEVARNLAAGDYRSAVQIGANGELGSDSGIGAYWIAYGAVTGNVASVINSSGSAVTQNYDEQLGYTGRFVVAPFSGVNWLAHFGVNGSFVGRPADALGPDAAVGAMRYPIQFRDRTEQRVEGTRLIDTGAFNSESASTLGLEAAFQHGPFYVEGEYQKLRINRLDSTLPDPDFDGFYVQGSWILTGESRRYNVVNGVFDAPSVNFPFNPSAGGWGAIELAARYSTLNLNDNEGAAGTAPAADSVRGGEQTITDVGVNWYLNSVVRVMVHGQNVEIDRLSPNAVTFNTPAGAQIGQKYKSLLARVQFAF